MKLLTVIGTRPQYIKSNALNDLVNKESHIKNIIVNTGQHYSFNMSDVFFKELNSIVPNYNLDIGGMTNNQMVAKMILSLDEVIKIEKPDSVIVYGDTDSTLAGAISAKKSGIKLIHIEAGLRSYNMSMHEEINRVITDRISDVLFCPTEISFDNLIKEGFSMFDSKIKIVGDVMLDVFKKFKKFEIRPELEFPKNFIFITLHRAENTDSLENLKFLVDSINSLSQFSNVIIAIHPRLKSSLDNFNLFFNKEIIKTPPLSYLEIIYVLNKAELIITDSGGLQKEAYFSNKPCITMRKNTEWVELIESGVNTLFNKDTPSLIEIYKIMKEVKVDSKPKLYGDGNASLKILKYLTENGK
jgi:UDP-GlcNAc3NAcA epimerase